MNNPYDPASSLEIVQADDASCTTDDGDCECSRSICSWKVAFGVIAGALLTLNVAFASMPSLAQTVVGFIPESMLPSGTSVVGSNMGCGCSHSMDSMEPLDEIDHLDQ